MEESIISFSLHFLISKHATFTRKLVLQVSGSRCVTISTSNYRFLALDITVNSRYNDKYGPFLLHAKLTRNAAKDLQDLYQVQWQIPRWSTLHTEIHWQTLLTLMQIKMSLCMHQDTEGVETKLKHSKTSTAHASGRLHAATALHPVKLFPVTNGTETL